MSPGAQSSVFRRNLKWQFAGSATQALLGATVLLVLGRFLDAEGFGQYSIIMGFVLVANLLVEPRMQDVAARHFWNFNAPESAAAGHDNHFADFLLLETFCKLLPLAALVALAWAITDLANLPREAPALIVIASTGQFFTKLGYGASSGLLRVLGRTDQITVCTSGELAVRLAVLLALAFTGQLTVASAITTTAITGSLANILQLRLAARRIPALGASLRQWKAAQALQRLRPQSRLLFSNLGLSCADLMNKDLDITLLSPVLPAEQVGIYKMAKNIALLAWRAIDPFIVALMPELSRRLSLGAYEDARRLIRLTALGMGALAIVLSALAYLALVLVGERVLGPAYGQVPDLIAWMFVGVIIGAPLVWGHPLIVALNRAEIAFIGNLFSLGIGLCAFFLLVNSFGITGAAIAWALTFLPFFIFTSTVAHRLFRRLASQNAAIS